MATKTWKSLFGRKTENEDDDLSQSPLALRVPPLSKHAEPPDLGIKRDHVSRRLAELTRFPLNLLHEVRDYLDQLNRVSIKPALRLELTEAAMRFACPVAGEIYLRFLNSGSGVPEDSERRDCLIAGTQAIHNGVISYKQIFKQDFGIIDERIIQRLELSGLRVLELSRIEQRLRALRYQKLPLEVWSDCSLVFFALRKRVEVDKPWRWLQTPGLNGANEGPSLLEKGGTSENLFISLQIFGLMDAITWPQDLTPVVDHYLRTMDPPLRCVPDDGQALTEDQVILYSGQSGPPRFERFGDQSREALLLELKGFDARLADDADWLTRYKMAGGQIESKPPKPLRKVPDNNRTTVVYLMRYKLQPHSRLDERHRSANEEYIRLHCGLDVCSALYQNEKEHSSDSADQGTAKKANSWMKFDESMGGIKLIAQEGDYSQQMFIGQLAAFQNEGEEHDGLPELGYIHRLERLHDNRIEAILIKLAKQACTVELQDPCGFGDDRAMGIYMQKDRDEWLLIISQKSGLVPGAPLWMYQDDAKKPLRLGDILLSTEEFEIFDLRMMPI